MKLYNRILLSCLFMSIIAVPCFSQQTEKSDAQTEPSKTAGLKKIASGSGLQNLNVNIDEEALQGSIDAAIETAMRSLTVAMNNLDIQLEAMEINLPEVNFDIEPIVITIPELDFNIEPIEIEFDDVDFDIDVDVLDCEDGDDDDQSFDKNKNKDNKGEKVKEKSDKADQENKDKTKGLKKIN